MTAELPFPDGDALRDEGMRRAASHADPDWKLAALAAVSFVARRLPELTTDDVWSLIEEVTHEPRALGPVMKAAATAGVIEATDRFKLTDRPSRHRAPVRVWRSLTYKEIQL